MTKTKVEHTPSTVEAKTKKQAEKEMPWASKIVKVEGGYMGFENWDDYKIWKNQK